MLTNHTTMFNICAVNIKSISNIYENKTKSVQICLDYTTITMS